jgi:hypothetical protein
MPKPPNLPADDEKAALYMAQALAAAQQLRYVHRDVSALVGMLGGLVETMTELPEGEQYMDGTARVSAVAMNAAYKLAWRIKDKVAVMAQIIVFIDYLSNGKGLWESLDDGD